MRVGMTELEAAARAINAEPWEPPPGMAKRQCSECRYFFAAPIASTERLCPDCAADRRGAGDLP
jgi:hypothetical protein